MTIKTPILAQLYTLAIVPACQRLGLDSQAARNLLLGTAAHESQGLYIAQWPSGPALGFFQQQLDRVDDTERRLSSDLLKRLYAQVIPDEADDQIAVNALYAAAHCRAAYWLVEEALPAADDVPGLAAYWKKYWNSVDGAGTVDEFIADFERLIGAPPAE